MRAVCVVGRSTSSRATLSPLARFHCKFIGFLLFPKRERSSVSANMIIQRLGRCFASRNPLRSIRCLERVSPTLQKKTAVEPFHLVLRSPSFSSCAKCSRSKRNSLFKLQTAKGSQEKKKKKTVGPKACRSEGALECSLKGFDGVTAELVRIL
ncbi:hypothetical protein TRVL_05923 [Trypanosoma vivax]|nr:hypothetical protein TRVL_05923 [Trypanosoma vivax]